MTACRGKAVATAELPGAGSADAQLQSTGAPLVLWADTDGKWHGDFSIWAPSARRMNPQRRSPRAHGAPPGWAGRDPEMDLPCDKGKVSSQ